ncbi:transcription elongation factor GreB [Xenorhabdus nematophila]|uniref:Transcription elongation factor GreB n=1 Tax=Xenorhabdus nematophila (strain ATCC 19061 / DSM 3370 / CCUG 14189 / LMG 1036 / NCIMB 9965 / AN6) TaxID=406817 RepID=D3VF02_XENNA|nr:transcription elongation factor GreB [Xenorhabdus nematophila]CEF30078.1 transcription elongation factor and transcript cleavage [Xenorhabdus nematophila str. Websteri]AYA41794.1 transcription elongation factor GreB [Xenorhabdus nematophila]KHD29442.1 transcription elongation factor GreB [Xenorhabdus nematophila]MBA0020524.1 transcription elongation factor GreB [Xenorhabdus nematophila]MCB4425878.1 transcription elongation factor GreB [Xenorhabdus nematophila]
MTKSHYITREGWHTLDQELKYLWKIERPNVTQAVSEAAALGDRSENAEYIYGKKRLREIDRRVRFLSKRLDILQIVDPDPRQEGKVFFGAWVKVENEQGEEHIFRLVGPDEFDPAKKWISIDSPVARALLGKQVDDEVTVMTPNGMATYWIRQIGYRPLVINQDN